jgi:hypothetical protein
LTLGYVDTPAGLALLEDRLDALKPPLPAHTGRLHDLLETPIRYLCRRGAPRLGRRHERTRYRGARPPAARPVRQRAGFPAGAPPSAFAGFARALM